MSKNQDAPYRPVTLTSRNLKVFDFLSFFLFYIGTVLSCNHRKTITFTSTFVHQRLKDEGTFPFFEVEESHQQRTQHSYTTHLQNSKQERVCMFLPLLDMTRSHLKRSRKQNHIILD
ncbi:hypothetical protein Gasu2_46150 [Galdieria sulphuraria]|nr:hypothetical protein Gasu2_46150 [Galdieria sulphuraria]